MSHSTASPNDYHVRREQQERRLAESACEGRARAIHSELAERYGRLNGGGSAIA